MTVQEPKPLNDLQPKQRSAFVTLVEPMPFASASDLDRVVKHGALPASAVAEAIAFYTRAGEAVLDLFSGSGTNLKVAQSADRVPTGVDLSDEAHAEYLLACSSDMLMEQAEYVVGDALATVQSMDKEGRKFDFVFMDPPRTQSRGGCEHNASFLGSRAKSVDEYVSYLAELVDASLRLVPPGRFVAVHLDMVYVDTELVDVPGLLGAAIRQKKSGARLRMYKSWHYRRTNALGNLGVAASNINSANLLAFDRTP